MVFIVDGRTWSQVLWLHDLSSAIKVDEVDNGKWMPGIAV